MACPGRDPSAEELRDVDSLLKTQEGLRGTVARGSLKLTRPDGIELHAWVAIMANAMEADRRWPKTPRNDPWAGGSAGWQEFCTEVTEDDPEPPRTDPARDVGCADFIGAVAASFPTTGPNSTRGAILLVVADYASADGSGAFPSNTTVGKKLSLGRDTVNGHVR